MLVDEYDYPLLRNIGNIPLAEDLRDVLRDFYASIKSLDAHIKFVFITGVTKFSKTSIFSGMNNLVDISLDPDGAHVLGYTQTELTNHFKKYIEAAAQSLGKSKEEILLKLKNWYNGYMFFQDTECVYNPFSILKFFDSNRFENYWFESGTPTFLMQLIKDNDYNVVNLETAIMSEREMKSFDFSRLPLTPMLFQTGYLTIKRYNRELKHYTLGFPNNEVQESFLTSIADYLFHIKTTTFESTTYQLKTQHQSVVLTL